MSAESQTKGFKIPLLEAGGRTTFLSAMFANFVIRRINALISLEVKRGTRDSFVISDSNAVLTLARVGDGVGGGTVDIEVCLPDTGETVTYRVTGEEV